MSNPFPYCGRGSLHEIGVNRKLRKIRYANKNKGKEKFLQKIYY